MSAVETFVLEDDPKWRTIAPDEEGHECSQRLCHRAAVSVFLRSVYHHGTRGYFYRRWYCCDLREHQYGRMTRYGNVWRPRRESDRAVAA